MGMISVDSVRVESSTTIAASSSTSVLSRILLAISLPTVFRYSSDALTRCSSCILRSAAISRPALFSSGQSSTDGRAKEGTVDVGVVL